MKLFLTKCRKNQFLNYQKKLDKQLNHRLNKSSSYSPSTTLDLLFTVLVIYIKHSNSKGTIIINSKSIPAGLMTESVDGYKNFMDYKEVTPILTQQLVSDVYLSMDDDLLRDFILTENEIFNSSLIPGEYKIILLNSELRVPNAVWYKLLAGVHENIGLESLLIRKKFVLKLLTASKEKLTKLQLIEDDINKLHTVYNILVNAIIDSAIFFNQYSDIYNFLFKELEYVHNIDGFYRFNKRKIINTLLNNLALNNNLFFFDLNENLETEINKYQIDLNDNERDTLNAFLKFDPNSIELRGFFPSSEPPRFTDQLLKDIKTEITFVVPYALDNPRGFVSKQNTRIEFRKIYNLFDDPLYRFFADKMISLNGMPATFLSDALGNIGSVSLIRIVLDEFYHPDFDINDGYVVPKDLQKEAAKRAGIYFPHKDIIIDTLHSVYENGAFPYDINLNEIISSLISNYLVQYIDSSYNVIFHKAFFLTNFDSYYKVKKKFSESLQKFYTKNEIFDIHDLIFNSEISNRNDFVNFCIQLIELTIKNPVEDGGLCRSLWNDDNTKPLAEPYSQSILFNQLRLIAEIKGVNLVQESKEAGGKLDFYFTYNNRNGLLMKVPIELKNAHHKLLDHGIETQLPLYMRSAKTNTGIYLILWYKSDDFDEPKKFKSIEDMGNYLQKKVISKKTDIRIVTINGSKKVSPSKKGAENRLI